MFVLNWSDNSRDGGSSDGMCCFVDCIGGTNETRKIETPVWCNAVQQCLMLMKWLYFFDFWPNSVVHLEPRLCGGVVVMCNIVSPSIKNIYRGAKKYHKYLYNKM